MGLLYLLLVLFPVIPALLPRRWAFLGFGLFTLVAGVFWLDMHVQPFGELNDRGLGTLLFGVWVIVGLVGFASVFLRAGVHRLLFGKTAQSDRTPPLALWPLPIGSLLAIFFMHWLSNRLAGATPAWAVHVAVTLAGSMVGAFLWRYRPSQRLLRDISHAAIAGCVGVVIWVAAGAFDAYRWASEARDHAGGLPYCVLTFAGRDHPRPARSVLDLSRLVSRSGGRSFIDDAHWLIVVEPEGLTAKRWRPNYGAMPFFEDRKIEDAACRPEIGGNIQ